MKDALGIDLRMGQRIAVPCNSRFKIGVLYNYRPNRTKWYLEMVAYLNGENIEDGHFNQQWRRRYYTPEKMEKESHKYYIRFQDGKTRAIANRESILGIPDDAELK